MIIGPFKEDGAKAHTHSLNSRMVPNEFSIFHRQRSLAPKLTRS